MKKNSLLEGLRLFGLFFEYHLKGHFADPINAFLAILSMLLNNVVFFTGLYLLAFQGQEQNQAYFHYYFVLTTAILIGTGFLNAFFWGLMDLGNMIENASIEKFLTYPRHPLLCIALSKANLASIGDLLQGIFMCLISIYLWGLGTALTTLIISFLVLIGFLGLNILAGSLAFFAQRGSTLGHLIYEITLTFSVFPLKDVLIGRYSILKYLTPAIFTAILPMEFLENRSLVVFFSLLISNSLFLLTSMLLFKRGRKHYQGNSMPNVF